MALFTITTKRKKICNGVQIEPGMTVQIVSPFANPVTVNGGDVKMTDVAQWLQTTVKILKDLAKPKSNSKK